MDVDLIISLIRAGDVEAFSSIDSKKLVDKKAYEYVKEFIVRYDKLPEEETLYKDLGIKPFGSEMEPPRYWVDKINKRHKMKLIKEAFTTAEKTLKEEKPLEDALVEIKKMLVDIEDTVDEGFLEISTGATDRIKEYDERAKFGGEIGISSPWKELDDITSGWCPGLTVVVGPTEIGKSWWLTKQFEHSSNMNDRPLFISVELVAKTVAARHDAIYAEVPYEDLRKGTLDGFSEKRFKERLTEMAKRKERGWIVDASWVMQPSDIEFLIHRLGPHIILLDGLYLLESGMKKAAAWEKTATVVRQLQLIANRTKKPIIATSQFRREIKKGAKRGEEKGELSDIGYSYAIPQGADVVLALKQDDIDIIKNEMLFDIIKGREIAKKVRGVKVRWEIPLDFTFVGYVGGSVEEEESVPEVGYEDDEEYGALFGEK